MAFTIPTTRASAYVVTATNWNEFVDDITWLGRDAPHVRVRNSAHISHATSGLTQTLTFDTEIYDVGACHSLVSNTGRLTVPSGGGGVYLVGGLIRYAANATGYRSALIQINGGSAVAQITVPAVAGGTTQTDVPVVTEYPLAAGDYIELRGGQTSGGALNMEQFPNAACTFFMSWRYQS